MKKKEKDLVKQQKKEERKAPPPRARRGHRRDHRAVKAPSEMTDGEEEPDDGRGDGRRGVRRG